MLNNWYWLLLFQPSSLILIPFFFLSHGLWSLQQASTLRREARKLEERAHELETEGWRQMREAVAGSEAEGLYGLLKGATSYPHPAPSHPPLKKPHISPGSTITQPPLLESTGPEVLNPVGQAIESTPPAATPEEDLLAHMQPLRVQVGGAKCMYQCWVEGCKEGLSTSRAAISTHIRKIHLGVGLVCPLCDKTFFNSDVLRHHRKTHN